MYTLPSVVSFLGNQPIQGRRNSLIRGVSPDDDSEALTNKDLNDNEKCPDNKTESRTSSTSIIDEHLKVDSYVQEGYYEDVDKKRDIQKPVLLWDWRTESSQTDVLHGRADRITACGGKVCMGSLMNTAPAHKPLAWKQVVFQAEDFIKQYYMDAGEHAPPTSTCSQRLQEVLTTLDEKGSYQLTLDELTWGARTAWRNAPRCPARMIWKNLHVFDKRGTFSSSSMFSSLVEHLEFSFNEGNIRPAVTIFRGRQPGTTEPRVWNSLLVAYAGYRQGNGSVVGDPAQADFTEFCQSLGWTGDGGMFDFLPLVVSGEDGLPCFQTISPDLQEKLRVKIRHPSIIGINSMNIEWFGLPGVSSMLFEVGGVQFPASPFTGWYQGTEIANRDLLDGQRYNLLVPLGKVMDLDTTTNTNLWKDEVALELNRAVLHSYKEAGVSIVDHYTQSDQFVQHMKSEIRSRRGCPADWVWIVPPQSGSLCSSFHQEMVTYHLSPSYEYQVKPWQYYGKGKSRKDIKSICWSFLFWVSTYGKIHNKRVPVSFIYGSETGVSKQFAYQAAEVFFPTVQMPHLSNEFC